MYLPRAIGNQQHTPRPKVGIGVLEKLLIVWSEIILGNQFAVQIESQLDDAVAVVFATGHVLVKSAVSAGDVEEVARILRDARSRLPESSQHPIRSRVPHALLLKSLRIVRQHPSVIGADVAMRRPRDVHQAILNQESGALPLAKRIESDLIAAVGVAVELSLDDQRSAKFFGTRGDVEGVQALKKFPILFGFRGQVHGVGGKIDRRRAGDSDFRNEIAAAYVPARNDVNPGAGVDETHLP